MGNLNNQKKEPDNKIEEKLKDINPVNLIEKVKSKYITFEIFSYLERILKLKIIKYNKKCQNLFGINIENYKERKIKRIMKKNGFGKEYTLDRNKLIFEGEFKNDKKNGKGKEYYESNGKILFEDTYLNGKRHGEGIEYYSDGKIKFEGEYSNGYKIEGKGYGYFGKVCFELDRNGKGIEYDNFYGKLIYEGEFLNEKKNGKGKEYDIISGTLKFDGEYKDDRLHGKVKKYDKNGKIIFEGEYKEGKKWNGISNDEYENTYDGPFKGCFQGEYLNGKRWNGKGEELGDYPLTRCKLGDLILFKGEYINGKRKGIGERCNNWKRKKYEVIIDEVNGNDKNI